MSVLGSLATLFFLTAGVSFVCVLVVLIVNDALRRVRVGFLELETACAHLFGAFEHPTDRGVHGVLGLFLAGWMATLAFFIAWQAGLFANITGSAIFSSAMLFGVVLALVIGFIALPFFGHGVFGHRHHPRAPVWTVILVFVYVLTLALIMAFLLAN